MNQTSLPNRGNAFKTTVIAPDWMPLLGNTARDTITNTADSYARVPLVFRATRIRANALLKLPRHIYPLKGGENKQEIDWMFAYPLDKLLWRTCAARLLRGASFTLMRRNSRTVTELQWLNPFTVNVHLDTRTGELYFDQYINGHRFPETGSWSQDEMLYVKEFSMTDDVGPGVGAASVALNDARLAHYLTRFASTFFENGAMPLTLITSKTGLGEDRERVESYFRNAIQGLRNAFRVIAVRGEDLDFKTTQSPLKDLATPELKEQARKDVALAFEIPVTLLDDDANYATAKEHKRGFYDETVIPDAQMIADEFNAQLLNPLGATIEFAPEEMDLYQEDEGERAQAWSTYVNAGMDMEVATALLGLDIPQDVLPVWQAQLDQKRERQAAPPMVAPPTQPIPPQLQPPSPDGAPAKALSDDLAKWERAAVKRIKKGGKLDFNSDTIPPTLLASIHGALEGATDASAVERIFGDARAWGQYP